MVGRRVFADAYDGKKAVVLNPRRKPAERNTNGRNLPRFSRTQAEPPSN